ncbi:MAG: SO_0444 family Cu/Zn efflux transporter [Thermoanaerobaculales bacterium]|nr:SO_0444 family Cu/Zn efflux transporter [Thermoanaerobaculales bacterium]
MVIVFQVLAASWILLGEMAPYLLLGFFIAGLLSVVVSPEWIERHLGRGGFAQVVKASLFGVPLPLCSCAVLPVAASLRRHGAGKGATTAFLLSTPQTGVDSIAATWALLGPVVAVIRPLAAFVTGLLGGAVAQAVDRNDDLGLMESHHAASASGDCCSSDKDSEATLIKVLRYGFLTLPRDIGRAIIVGLLLSGIIAAFLEPHALEGILGEGVLPYLVAMAVGVPLYVCATASTPIAASLIGAGLSPGAALVFLISGPATNFAALTTLLRVLGRRTSGVYLATVIVGSLATGLLVDAVLDAESLALPALSVMSTAHEHAHGARGGLGFQEVCALVLIAVLAAAMWPRE